jgi:small subunit ribosomal protein S1
VRVRILEIDSERRRLSLSIKRVEGQQLPRRDMTSPEQSAAGDLDDVPELGLSEDVFAGPQVTVEGAENLQAAVDASEEAAAAAGAEAPGGEVAEGQATEEEAAAAEVEEPAAPAEEPPAEEPPAEESPAGDEAPAEGEAPEGEST